MYTLCIGLQLKRLQHGLTGRPTGEEYESGFF